MYIHPECTRAERDAQWRLLWRTLNRHNAAGLPILVGGDLNIRSPAVLHRELSNLYISLFPFHTCNRTRHNRKAKGSWTTLDYYVGNSAALFHNTKTLTWVDTSDHFPILTSLRKDGAWSPEAPSKQARWVPIPALPPTIKDSFCSDNAFDALRDTILNSPSHSASELTDCFTATTNSAGRSHKLLALNPPIDKPTYRLTKRTIKLLRKRRRAFRRATRNGATSTARSRYRRAAQKARKALRKDHRKGFAAYLERGATLLSKPQAFWRWAKPLARGPSTSVAPTMIANVEGKIVSTPSEVASAWTQHYQSLFADCTTHSKEPWQTFKSRVPREWRPKRHPVWSETLHNADPTWHELAKALSESKSGKAPGMDGFVETVRFSSTIPYLGLADVLS